MTDTDLLGLPLVVDSEDGVSYKLEPYAASVENVHFLWDVAGKHDFLFSDTTHGAPELFVDYLLSPGVIILLVSNEQGPVGILYADQLRPKLDARVHYLFWDKHHAGRQRVLLVSMLWFMSNFELQRLNMEIPTYAFAALRRMHKMGVRIEGRRRSAVSYNHQWRDALLFGITVDEITVAAIENAQLERTEQEADWFGLLSSDDILRVAIAKER